MIKIYDQYGDGEFVVCACGCCAVRPWLDLSEPEIGLTLWRLVGQLALNPWKRLSQIWWIIKEGSPYVGEILMTPVQARDLAATLWNMAGVAEEADISNSRA